MKTTVLIENLDFQAFKKACFELDVKIINEIFYSDYLKSIEIELLHETTLFYLGQLTQHFIQSKFNLQ